ncbi:MAG: phage head-tail connector protein [Variibacter sp.]|mgnify:CR=1 FL=1|nr:phage head-tail connector protein [Variibacter sp.]
MAAILLSGPAVEPLTLAEAKSYLRVEHDDDDALIAALVAAVRAEVEAKTRRALITQRWRWILDAWPRDGRIALAPAPVREILAARVYDENGIAQAIDTQAFVVDTAAAPGVIGFVSWALPAPGRAVAGIEIDVACGYGDAAADVPEPLRQAMRVLLAHRYENRGLAAAADAGPASVAALLSPYRVMAL